MNDLDAAAPLEIPEFCKLVRMGKSSFFRHAAAGLIPIIKIGRKTLVPREAALRIAREGLPVNPPGRTKGGTRTA